MSENPGYLISAGIVACEHAPRFASGCGPNSRRPCWIFLSACACAQCIKQVFIWLTAAACISDPRTTAMRLVVSSGCLQDLVRRHTRALERSACSNDLDQARNGTKISVCEVVSHLPRCDARLRLAAKPFRAVECPRLDTRQLIFIAVRE
jgi:hypothetical protein